MRWNENSAMLLMQGNRMPKNDCGVYFCTFTAFI